ncbi:MAG: glutaminyl-peptide cyclotransferase [Ignavibacteria bacterium]|nr:glutaminyl-peptide cyclotransferase [Ignavibacteria bacterium]
MVQPYSSAKDKLELAKILHSFALFCIILFFFSCTKKEEIPYEKRENIKITEKPKVESVENTKIYQIEVIRKIPHDNDAFTQGLVFHNGFLYESTGEYGKSSLRKINPATGKVEKKIQLENHLFAEGMAIHDNKIFLLTWQNNQILILDPQTFNYIKRVDFLGEGWGLTNLDEKFLVQSDGTNILKIVNPETFQIEGKLMVTDKSAPVANLNELENIEGDIWANIWMKDLIAVIDLLNGKVKFWIDVSSLRNFLKPNDDVDVINGIAYDKQNKRIFLTGKYWPYIFEVKLKY